MAYHSMDNITSLIIVFEDYGRMDLPKPKKSSRLSQNLNNFQEEEDNQK